MLSWQRFLDSLDSPGGHIVILLVCIAGGLEAIHLGLMGTDIVAGAFGALLIYLKAGK